jgi:hypothetical protein
MAYKFGLFDYLVLTYFISHIPITLCIDGQAILPSIGVTYPQALRDLLAYHVSMFQDPLMNPIKGQPGWFKAIVLIEVLLQLPFFFVVVYAWLKRAEWIRIPLIIYGAHTATTLIPIYGAFWEANISSSLKLQLFAIYAPYLVMPLAVMLKAARSTKLFPSSAIWKRD